MTTKKIMLLHKGQALVLYRMIYGFSQQQIADVEGIGKATVCRYENGEYVGHKNEEMYDNIFSRYVEKIME